MKVKCRCALIFCFLLVAVPLLAQETEEWLKKSSQARKLLHSQPHISMEIAKEYYTVASQSNNSWLYADAHYLMGQSLIATGNYSRALEKLVQGIDYLNAKENLSDSLQALKAEMLNAQGTAYMMLEMWSQSLNAFEEALNISRQQHHSTNMVRIYNNLGILFGKMQDTLQAIQHYRQALRLAEELKNESLQAAALVNIAIWHKNRREYQLALNYYLQALAIRQQLKDLRGRGLILANMANIYQELQQYKEAFQYIHQAKAIFKHLGDNFMLTKAMASIGEFHLFTDNLDSAALFLDQSLSVAAANNWLEITAQTSEQLSQVFAKRQEYKTALCYYRYADSVKKLLFNEEKVQMAERAKARYNWQQQQMEIEQLRQKTLWAQIDNQRQQKIIELLSKESQLNELIAEKNQLKVSLLTSEKQLLEQQRQNAQQQISRQQAELRLQSLLNAENQLKLKLQEEKISYNRLLLIAGSIILVLSMAIAYLMIKRTKQRVVRNQQRYEAIMEEISFINSHEMRAPVATALGLIHLIKLEATAGVYNPTLIDLLEQALKEIDEMVHFVSERTNQIYVSAKK